MAVCGAQTSVSDRLKLHAEDTEVQHRRLAQLINELSNLLTLEQGRCPGVRRLLGSLISFAEIHFSDQEEFLKHNDYPGEQLEIHQSAHQQFLDRLRSIQEESDTDLLATGPALIAWVRGWMEAHTQAEDQAYLDHFFRKEFQI